MEGNNTDNTAQSQPNAPGETLHYSTHLSDRRQHKGFAIGVPVGSHSQVDLLGIGVSLERLSHTCRSTGSMSQPSNLLTPM